MKTETLVTADRSLADEWLRKFDAREPLEVEGQQYLIEETFAEFTQGVGFKCMTITLTPVTVTVKVLDLSNPPEGATHYNPRDVRHPFRKRLGDLCFAWRSDDLSWVQLKNKPTQCQWEPLCPQWVGRIQRQTFSAENPQHQQIPKAARPIIKRQRTIEDYIACNWPRSPYAGRGLNFPCTQKPVEPAQWGGEGLPPVGVDFEVLWSSTCKTYVTAKAVGHEEDGRVVYRITSGERAGEYQAERPHSYETDTVPNFRPIKTAEQLAAAQREAEITRFAEDITAGRSPLGSFEHSKVVATWLYDNDYRKVTK